MAQQIRKGSARRRKVQPERGKQENHLEFVQDYIPLKEIRNGIVETTDGRYLKILEIEPINFLLRSNEEQWGIISTFASWLKISPMRLQFKSITRKADSDRYVAGLEADIETEVSPIIGNEAQSSEFIEKLIADYETEPEKIWDLNIFGHTLSSMVSDGMQNKLYRMPEDAREKMQETLQRIVNEGSGGLICIIL